MFKAMILLKRQNVMSFNDFSNWWLNDHAPLARQLPGLKKAVFNLSSSDGASEYDGVSELWFESEDEFDAAYASAIGKAVAADSLSKVSRRERILVQEHVIFPE
jgi:uncharacterized protein (TIGR02118 family)